MKIRKDKKTRRWVSPLIDNVSRDIEISPLAWRDPDFCVEHEILCNAMARSSGR